MATLDLTEVSPPAVMSHWRDMQKVYKLCAKESWFWHFWNSEYFALQPQCSYRIVFLCKIHIFNFNCRYLRIPAALLVRNTNSPYNFIVNLLGIQANIGSPILGNGDVSAKGCVWNFKVYGSIKCLRVTPLSAGDSPTENTLGLANAEKAAFLTLD